MLYQKLQENLNKEKNKTKRSDGGNSLAVQRLGFYTFIAEGPGGSIPGWKSKIPQAIKKKEKIKKKIIIMYKHYGL